MNTFTTPCFIRKNTPEILEKLESIGIRSFLLDRELNSWGDNIKVFGAGLRVYSCSDSINKIDGIDCGTNEELFLSIAALNDENSYRQWYICKISDNPDIKDMWHFCERPSMDEDSRFFGLISFRKATVDELIEHFK